MPGQCDRVTSARGQKGPELQFLLILREAPGLSGTYDLPRPPLISCMWAKSGPWLLPLPGKEAQLSMQEATASSRTFARQATGVGLAQWGRNFTDRTQPQHCDIYKLCEPGDCRGKERRPGLWSSDSLLGDIELIS